MSKVLLVDDDVELVSMIREYLEQEGFETHAVHDGEAGAAEALTGDYAIAVLDVMMPRLNGVETLRRIRQGSRMPVIMLTARGDDVDRIVGLELGADDYVPKPCSPRELVARIRAILRRSGGEGAAVEDTARLRDALGKNQCEEQGQHDSQPRPVESFHVVTPRRRPRACRSCRLWSTPLPRR